MVLLGVFAVATASCSGKDSAGSYYNAGMDALESGNYQEASDNFKKAIEKKEDKAAYYIADGIALVKLGQYEDALTEFDHAVVDMKSSITDKNKKKAFRGKGIAYYYMGDYESAISTLIEAKEIDQVNDLNPDINSYLAECYLAQDKYAEAIAVYDGMIEEDSKSAVAYVLRAKAQALAGNVEKAKEDFNQAIGLDKKNYQYYLLAYETLTEGGNESAAAEFLKSASELSPKTKEERYYADKVAYYQGKTEEAIASLTEIAPEYIEAYCLLGEIYYANAQYSNAIDSYVTYMGADGATPSDKVYYDLALCYMETENYTSALEYIRAGLATADKKFERELKYEEIYALEKSGEFNEAYELAKEYVTVYPDDEKMQRELIFLETRYNK